MTTVSRFSRQNDAGLRALNVALWENLVLVVVLVLESKGPYYNKRVLLFNFNLWKRKIVGRADVLRTKYSFYLEQHRENWMGK